VISFRYHLVSIIGVFLALALGIVIGTTALNGPITTDLRKQVDSLKTDRTTLATQVKTLQNQVSDANQFASTYGSTLVQRALTDLNGKPVPVLVVAMPGAASNVIDGISGEVADAGGKVTGRLQLTSNYVDPSQASAIDTLVITGGLQPQGLHLTETSDAGVLGGEMLSYVLVGKGQPTDLTSVISAFANLHMVTASATLAPSKTVVVVGTGNLSKTSGTPEIAFISALQQAGANVVVAGDAASSEPTGLVGLTRSQDKATVSTVDNADSSIGEVSTIFATAGVLKSQFGHYGTGPGAQALFPSVS
jgi:hypothetical protein